MSNPVLVDIVRNGIIESCHRGSAVVVDNSGNVVFSIGDADRSIYPRSAIKPLQALPILESGAAQQFDLSLKEISLSCASHNSEDIHVDSVTQWLNRLGLGIDNLECGKAFPSYQKAAHQLIKEGKDASKAHHNCSGKHSGMLTLARHLVPEVQGYSAHSHVVQQAWMQTLSELINEDVSKMHWEQDGCGLPAIYMPMQKLALAFARFSEPEKQSDIRAAAMKKIIEALTRYPEMIAGSERCCSALIRETQGKVVAKLGAEAVYAGVVPHLNLGFALKVDDGSIRGCEVALGALLNKINALSNEENVRLKDFFNPSITNSLNHVTGEMRPSENWDA
jgi:L-asparaginase II